MIDAQFRSVFKLIIIGSITILGLYLFAQIGDSSQIKGWFTLAPPIVAIFLAWFWREAILALFIGIWMGAWVSYNLSFSGIVNSFFDTTQVYILGALTDSGHASIILFTLIIGGTISILIANGGIKGMVNLIVPLANSPRRTQLAAAILGLAIFFDDYANTLFVGPSMRSLFDRFKISREKLAYIVDSTAAPVSCLALVSTWVGYQVGLIKDGIDPILELTEDAYEIFLNSIAYSFYPLLAIFFVFAVAWTKRDFGPMLEAEKLARDRDNNSESPLTNNLELNSDKPARAINAIIPLVAMLLTTLMALYFTGISSETQVISLQSIISESDPYKALLWGSQVGLFFAVILSLGQKILSLQEIFNAWSKGLKSMLQAVIVLLLAWSLGAVLKEIGTSEFLISILGERLIPQLLPTLIFLLSAAIAFASGTSFGTMAIVMPIVVPLSWSLIANSNLDLSYILYAAIASVLAGSVWGDHCSPVSDTTILTSIASECNHIDHVRTQLPYAFLVGTISIFCGTLPAGFGLPWWICSLCGALILVLFLYRFGKKTPSKLQKQELKEPVVK